MGAGGVGGYFGGKLARAGEEVIFIARGPHCEEIAKNGLQVRSPSGDFKVKAAATDDPSKLQPVDLVLFCVKGYDTQEAAKLIKPIMARETTVISLQNGVEKEDILGSILGTSNVMGGLCKLSALIEAPGIIKHLGLESLTFGELDGSESDRGKDILEVFKKAGVNANLSRNVTAEEWEKFAFICALGGLGSITRLPAGPILRFDKTRKMYASVVTEIVEVGRKKSVSFDGDVVQRLMDFSDGLSPDVRPSMYRDLMDGKRIEIDTLNGAVVRYGHALHVPTPTNEFITSCLSVINQVNLENKI